jgi:hypothetical protein
MKNPSDLPSLPGEWCVYELFNRCHGTVCPVYAGLNSNGSECAYGAAIVIHPESKSIDINPRDELSRGCLARIYSREFTLKITGEISRGALLEIFDSAKFKSIIEQIDKSWVLFWDGKNQVGKLPEDIRQSLFCLEEEMLFSPPECAQVMMLSEFLMAIDSDEDGEEVEIMDAISIDIGYDDSNVMTASTDIEDFKDDFYSQAEAYGVIDIDELPNILDEFYEHVCRNTNALGKTG